MFDAQELHGTRRRARESEYAAEAGRVAALLATRGQSVLGWVHAPFGWGTREVDDSTVPGARGGFPELPWGLCALTLLPPVAFPVLAYLEARLKRERLIYWSRTGYWRRVTARDKWRYLSTVALLMAGPCVGLADSALMPFALVWFGILLLFWLPALVTAPLGALAGKERLDAYLESFAAHALTVREVACPLCAEQIPVGTQICPWCGSALGR